MYFIKIHIQSAHCSRRERTTISVLPRYKTGQDSNQAAVIKFYLRALTFAMAYQEMHSTKTAKTHLRIYYLNSKL